MIKLGPAQEKFLVWMFFNKSWYDGSPNRWGSPQDTIRVAESLHRKGLLSKRQGTFKAATGPQTVVRDIFEINVKGYEVAEQLRSKVAAARRDLKTA
jgi:hypothetical protein